VGHPPDHAASCTARQHRPELAADQRAEQAPGHRHGHEQEGQQILGLDFERNVQEWALNSNDIVMSIASRSLTVLRYSRRDNLRKTLFPPVLVACSRITASNSVAWLIAFSRSSLLGCCESSGGIAPRVIWSMISCNFSCVSN
jgi:hypothetical protein